MDVVALSQFGFSQAVATLGTACTPVHVQKLLRQTDQVIFSFDGDTAGRRAARRALEACLPHATDNRTLKFLFLPTEHDPDSYIREHGNDAFERMVHESIPLSQFLIAQVTEDKDLITAEGRARAQYDAKPMLQAMPPSSLRLQLLRQLAQITDSTVPELESLFELAKPAAGGRFMKSAPPAVRRRPPVELERKVLRILLAHPEFAADLDDDALQAIGLSVPDQGEMLRAVVQAARTLSGDAGFAALAERLRDQTGLDKLLAEVAADTPSEPELARRELAGAVRQTRMKILRAEQEKLVAGGLPDDAARNRYRELAATLDRLRAEAERDLMA
jgi:DNA primase